MYHCDTFDKGLRRNNLRFPRCPFGAADGGDRPPRHQGEAKAGQEATEATESKSEDSFLGSTGHRPTGIELGELPALFYLSSDGGGGEGRGEELHFYWVSPLPARSSRGEDGELDAALGSAPGANKDNPPRRERLTLPVGGSPTGTGGSPVLPIFPRNTFNHKSLDQIMSNISR